LTAASRQRQWLGLASADVLAAFCDAQLSAETHGCKALPYSGAPAAHHRLLWRQHRAKGSGFGWPALL
jgi:hypothetical protein